MSTIWDITLGVPTFPFEANSEAFCKFFEAIEAMPILQAYPNDTEIMRYKLITLPRGTAKIPVLDLGYTSITLKQGASLAITPQTLNYLGATSTFEQSGYTATIGDVRTMASFNGVAGSSKTKAGSKLAPPLKSISALNIAAGIIYPNSSRLRWCCNQKTRRIYKIIQSYPLY